MNITVNPYVNVQYLKLQSKFHDILSSHFLQMMRALTKIIVLRKFTLNFKLSFGHVKRAQSVLNSISFVKRFFA